MVGKPVLRGDNGSMLKATTVPAMRQWQGVNPCYSCPRMSNGNTLVALLFKTVRQRA